MSTITLIELFHLKFFSRFDATLLGEDLMLLQNQMIDDALDPPRKSNVVSAAFAIAHTRSILY